MANYLNIEEVLLKLISQSGTTLTSDTLPIGAIIVYPEAQVYPDGWLRCDGQAVSRTTYADLYTLLGDAFGSGDGSTTFNLPTITHTTSKLTYLMKVKIITPIEAVVVDNVVTTSGTDALSANMGVFLNASVTEISEYKDEYLLTETETEALIDSTKTW